MRNGCTAVWKNAGIDPTHLQTSSAFVEEGEWYDPPSAQKKHRAKSPLKKIRCVRVRWLSRRGQQTRFEKQRAYEEALPGGGSGTAPYEEALPGGGSGTAR